LESQQPGVLDVESYDSKNAPLGKQHEAGCRISNRLACQLRNCAQAAGANNTMSKKLLAYWHLWVGEIASLLLLVTSRLPSRGVELLVAVLDALNRRQEQRRFTTMLITLGIIR
jgi:hypothetical protein